LTFYLYNFCRKRYPGHSALCVDLPRRPAELFALLQRTEPQCVGRRIVGRTRINGRAAYFAESVNPLDAAIAGLDVSARLSFQKVKAVRRRQNVCAKRRPSETLAIEAMADTHGTGLNFSLIGNRAAVAFTFNFHESLPRKLFGE
jgi:hypothetical protein